jgi:ABC-2 type transport system permease protein
MSDEAYVNTVPSDGQQTLVVMKYDILKHLRSKRLLGMLAVEAVLLALISALVIGEHAQPFTDTMGGFASATSILVIVAATLFAGDAIVSEFQGRTGYLLFPNPVKRSSIFLGKFLSAAAAMVLVMAIYYAVAIGISAAVSSDLEHLELAFASLGLALLYSIAAISLGMLVSSFMKGSTGSLILTFFLLFLILPSVDSIFSLVSYPPTPSLTFAAMAIAAVLTVPYPPETSMLTTPLEGLGEFTTYIHTPPVLTAVVVMVAWAIATMVLAYLLFRRREMSA